MAIGLKFPSGGFKHSTYQNFVYLYV